MGLSVLFSLSSIFHFFFYFFLLCFLYVVENMSCFFWVPGEFILSSIFFFFFAFFFFFCTSNVHIDRGLEMCVQAFALAVVGIWSGTSCLITLV